MWLLTSSHSPLLSRHVDHLSELLYTLARFCNTHIVQACGINGRDGTVELAEELFSAMQQRTNHFSSYIAPTELTYQRLMQVRVSLSSVLSMHRTVVFDIPVYDNVFKNIDIINGTEV